MVCPDDTLLGISVIEHQRRLILGTFGNLIPYRFAYLFEEKPKLHGTVHGIHKPLPHLIPNHLKTTQEKHLDYDDDEPVYLSAGPRISREHDPVSFMWQLCVRGGARNLSAEAANCFRRYTRDLRNGRIYPWNGDDFHHVFTEG